MIRLTTGGIKKQPTPSAVVVRNRKFDRCIAFDERSRNYPIRKVVSKKPRSYTWSVGVWLDQGSEGACVGFSWAQELAARPVVCRDLTDSFARNRIYLEAQKIDEWPGEDYEGTSVLAGAKIVANLGAMAEYRWAFGLEDLRLAVGHAGPAVLGINWYDGMFDTGPDGFIRPTGALAGGHAICCFGVNQKERYFKLHNSWGRSWGRDGVALVTFDDMERLLEEQGEACVPVKRKRIDLLEAA
jgi:hypothetical protein